MTARHVITHDCHHPAGKAVPCCAAECMPGCCDGHVVWVIWVMCCLSRVMMVVVLNATNRNDIGVCECHLWPGSVLLHAHGRRSPTGCTVGIWWMSTTPTTACCNVAGRVVVVMVSLSSVPQELAPGAGNQCSAGILQCVYGVWQATSMHTTLQLNVVLAVFVGGRSQEQQQQQQY